jgi:vacuolar-type H+-ATPase subunit H
MRDVLQSVITAETEAKGIVAAALQEAARVLSDARREGESLAGQIRQEARAEGEALQEVVMKEALQEEKVQLAAAVAEIEARFRLEAGVRQDAINAVLRCVCSSP